MLVDAVMDRGESRLSRHNRCARPKPREYGRDQLVGNFGTGHEHPHRNGRFRRQERKPSGITPAIVQT